VKPLLPLLLAACLLPSPAAFAQARTFTRPAYVPPSARGAAAKPAEPAPEAPAPAAEEPPRFVTNAFGDLVKVKDYSQYRPPYGTSEELKALIASPRFDLVPRHPEQVKNEKEWQKILTLQNETGACILLRFVQTQDSADKNGTVSAAERGRVKWFASKHGAAKLWQEAVQKFIQVDIVLPGNDFAKGLDQKIRQGEKTLFFVLRPNDSHPFSVGVFSYDQAARKMELRPLEDCLARLKQVATPAYSGIRTK
jgi:hypothetical protein